MEHGKKIKILDGQVFKIINLLKRNVEMSSEVLNELRNAIIKYVRGQGRQLRFRGNGW